MHCVLLVAAVAAFPATRNSAPETFFYPETQSYASSTAAFSSSDPAEIALLSLVNALGVNADQLKMASRFMDSAGVEHLYFDRVHNGIIVKNNNAAVHLKDGAIVSQTSSFKAMPNQLVAPAVVRVSLQEAIKIAEAELGASKDSVEAALIFIQLPSGAVAYAHEFQVRNDRDSKWFQVTVNAESGAIVQVVDFYNRASYKAIQIPQLVPTDGFTVIQGVEDKVASPNGWNSDGTTTYTTTQGNNVDVSIGSYRPDAGSSLVFDSNWDATAAPNSDANKKTSATHLFYLINRMHDISYQYGFTEAAGNFQQKNYAKGGKEGDRVKANDQSSQGMNNANFATPPDGQAGVMNMYLFDITNPHRDGTLDSIIPIHEFTHGISNRLTGGSRNGQCLQSSESGGMGEGWSDTLAVYLGQTATNTRAGNFPMGYYVLGQASNGAGIRRYPYSTDLKTNPLTYSAFKKSSEVHNVGEIWATTLFEMYWNLVDKLGFSDNWMDATSPKGNIVAMQVVIGGMMLQPCNPNMLQARDAIILADKNYYNGANACDIWKAFAKRGLGTDSVQKTHTDGFKMPDTCN